MNERIESIFVWAFAIFITGVFLCTAFILYQTISYERAFNRNIQKMMQRSYINYRSVVSTEFLDLCGKHGERFVVYANACEVDGKLVQTIHGVRVR